MAESREIPLTRGLVAVVDAADYDDLAQFKWHVAANDTSGPYAVRSTKSQGKRAKERMHRRLLPAALIVDHINGNGLDNRRSNLREATTAENMRNRSGLAIDNTSGYRGVHWRKDRQKWRAWICVDHRGRHLGLFGTAEEAAYAFDDAALKLFGDYIGYLNFPERANPICATGRPGHDAPSSASRPVTTPLPG
jgi:hypothetical protein